MGILHTTPKAAPGRQPGGSPWHNGLGQLEHAAVKEQPRRKPETCPRAGVEKGSVPLIDKLMPFSDADAR